MCGERQVQWRECLKNLRELYDRKHFFRLFKGRLAPQTIQKIFDKGIYKLNINKNTQQIIISVFMDAIDNKTDKDNSLYISIYHFVLEKMGRIFIYEQNIINRYIGKYKIYRSGLNGVISGSLDIYRDKDLYMFNHYSIQNIDGKDIEFNHKGLIFYIGNRLYFLGIGFSEFGFYMRPMIVRGADNPKDCILFGVLLTETYNDMKPFSSIICLISDDLIKRNSKVNIEYVHSLLRNKSKIKEGGILYPPDNIPPSAIKK